MNWKRALVAGSALFAAVAAALQTETVQQAWAAFMAAVQ